jgi:hypothetical protein
VHERAVCQGLGAVFEDRAMICYHVDEMLRGEQLLDRDAVLADGSTRGGFLEVRNDR